MIERSRLVAIVPLAAQGLVAHPPINALGLTALAALVMTVGSR